MGLLPSPHPQEGRAAIPHLPPGQAGRLRYASRAAQRRGSCQTHESGPWVEGLLGKVRRTSYSAQALGCCQHQTAPD